ncbi:Ig-like domain-containing protein [Streptomyces sp. NPDC053427]|uniref:L,D-transpeptidase n=1 Tax=Streptomyces sp. NPDC053427 TaxID=3365701 RepID=UPI0037D33027
MTGGEMRSAKNPAMHPAEAPAELPAEVPAKAHAGKGSPGRVRTRVRRLRTALVAMGALTAAVLPAACASSDGLVGGGATFPGAAIRVVPGDGAHDVGAGGRFEVRVPAGRLERVEVRRTGDAGRQRVAGRITPDGLIWRPAAGALAPGSRYTVDAVALDGAGHRSARHTTFTTSVPRGRFAGFFSPEDGTTVGTGMIVSLEFNRPIADRAAVERAVTVTADPAVEIAPHWFGNRRLDFRPRERWRPGTDISLALRLRGVRAGPDMYGTQRKTIHYRVGRDQITLVDVARHTLTVRRRGRAPVTFPVTAGNAENPTYNGKMVILERRSVTRMNGHTVGFGGEYDIADVPHAMRLTRSGTFLHGNYWARPRVFGGANTSHGCVGLKDIKGGGRATPAGWLFRHSIVGDTVQVHHSRGGTVAPDNGLGGWNLPWGQWKRGSALG